MFSVENRLSNSVSAVSIVGIVSFYNTGSASGSALHQTGSAFALPCHTVAPPLRITADYFK